MILWLILFHSSCLQMYNKALIIYTDARTSDSLAFIKDELKRWDEHQIPDDTDRKLRSFFESKYMYEIPVLS